MKKYIFTSLFCILLLTGCTTNTQVANPIIAVNTIEEMNDYLNYKVPVLDKDVKDYILIKDTTHAKILYEDNTEFDIDKDEETVSGIYGGAKVKEEIIENMNVKYYVYDNIHYAIWTNGTYSFSYQNMNDNINFDELKILCEKTKDLK